MEVVAIKDGFLQTKALMVVTKASIPEMVVTKASILEMVVTKDSILVKVFILDLEDVINSKVSNAAVNNASKSVSRYQEEFQSEGM